MTPVRDSLERLLRKRAEEDRDFWPMPDLREAAAPAAIDQLERLAGFPLPASYRDLLRFTDGVRAFQGSLSLLGSLDWPAGAAVEAALRIRSGFFEAGMLEELGIADREEDLFPIGGGEGSDNALFASRRVLIPGAQETIVWLGLSDAFCFASLQDLIEYEIDPADVIATGRLVSFPIE